MNVIEVIYDVNARNLIVKCKLNERCLYLVNVYAPVSAEAPEQKMFIEDLDRKLHTYYNNGAILMAGDYNTTLNPVKDRKDFVEGVRHVSSREYWLKLKQLGETTSLLMSGEPRTHMK